MRKPEEPFIILMADDDEDDLLLVQDAIKECGYHAHFYSVQDGEELMDYLHRNGKYSTPSLSPRPHLILLDLNMPRKSGIEALQEIKNDPDLKTIPVVVFSTSDDEKVKLSAHLLGARSFVTKPNTFDELVAVLESHCPEWLDLT